MMLMLTAVMEKALPVFAMLALGVLCRKKAILSRESISGLKTLVVNITLPAVMFSAFANAEYSLGSLWIPVMMFLICVLMLLTGMAGCRLLGVSGRLSPYLSAGFEAGMLGYALFALLFPKDGTSAFAIVDLGQVLFVFTVYKALLAGRQGLGGAAHEALRAPTVWAILLGILLGATGLYGKLQPSGISHVMDAVAAFIAAPTGAVILLSIGYDLASGQIRWRKTGGLIVMRIVISAAALLIAWLVNRYLLNDLIHPGALVLMFTLPPPYVLPVFADVAEERADISSALSGLTLISLVLFTAMTVIYR